MVEIDTSEPMFLEPWRCSQCGLFLYCIDAEGKPTPGAPIGLAIGTEGNRRRVCSMCAVMYIVVNESRYMVEQHLDWKKEQSRRREKLGVSGRYLDSDDCERAN